MATTETHGETKIKKTLDFENKVILLIYSLIL